VQQDFHRLEPVRKRVAVTVYEDQLLVSYAAARPVKPAPVPTLTNARRGLEPPASCEDDS
jgi:hypothetical protein